MGYPAAVVERTMKVQEATPLAQLGPRGQILMRSTSTVRHGDMGECNLVR